MIRFSTLPMTKKNYPRSTPSGIRLFFDPLPLRSKEISIRGLGIRELMDPGICERPHGTGDYLLMLFHHPALMSCSSGPGPMQTEETMMIWPPSKGQYYGNPASGYSHSWIHCQGTRIEKILRSSRIPVLKPFPVVQSPFFQQCLLDIHSELVSYNKPDPILVGNLLENVLREFARADHSTGKNIRLPENLLAVRNLIGAAPSRNISLAEMAAKAGMSVPYFCARFKASFGLPPKEYLIRNRMHHAAHLLGDQNLNITEIAARVGYDDLFHFSKTFKKHFGKSPRQMRLKPGKPGHSLSRL